MTGGPLSTAQAASLCGMSPAGFRGAMTRLRRRGQDFRLPGVDARTPLWDAGALEVWLTSRGRKQ